AKRQYFRFSTRSSGEKLTVFVNLYDNTDFHTACLPGGRPYNIKHQIKFPGRQYYRVRHTDLKSLVEGDNTIEALDAYTISLYGKSEVLTSYLNSEFR
ncbi:MAG: hypothetical protein WA220_07780, partial [Candidatus Nitrosopolaris sp.]